MGLPGPRTYKYQEIKECLRFCQLPPETGDGGSIPKIWPCLVFESLQKCHDVVKTQLGLDYQMFDLFTRRIKQGGPNQVVVLLGDHPPVARFLDDVSLVLEQPFIVVFLNKAEQYKDNESFWQAVEVGLKIVDLKDESTTNPLFTTKRPLTNATALTTKPMAFAGPLTNPDSEEANAKLPASDTGDLPSTVTNKGNNGRYVPVKNADTKSASQLVSESIASQSIATQSEGTKDTPPPTRTSQSPTHKPMTRKSLNEESKDSSNDMEIEFETASVSSHQTRASRRNNEESQSDTQTPPARKRKSGSATKRPPSSTKKRKEDREKVSIPDFSDIRRLLVQGGYKFDKTGCYRPGCDTSYTVEELRRNLCEYGVSCKCGGTSGNDKPCECWDAEQKLDIHLWVRYSVFHASPPEEGIVPISQREAVSLLMKMGFKYQSDHGYISPGVGKSNIANRKAFHDGAHLIRHLSRFGLPETCNFDALTEDERFSLEYVMSAPDKPVDTFTRLDEADKNPLSDVSICSPPNSGRRTRTRRGTYINDDVTVVTNASELSTKPANDPGGTEEQAAPAFDASKVLSPLTTQKGTARVSMSPRRLVKDTPLPKFSGTDEDKLHSCLESLNSSEHTLDLFVGERSSPNLKAITSFLLNAMDSGGAQGGQNSTAALYVCGAPGVGKTCGLKWAYEKALEQSSGTTDPILCFLNCSHIIADKDPQRKIWSELGSSLGMKPRQRSEQSIMGKLDSNSKFSSKAVAILVLDEIECFLASDKKKGILRTLLDWANDPHMRLALVGISNSMNDGNVATIKELGDVSVINVDNTHYLTKFINQFMDTVTFTAYGESEVRDILKRRVGDSVFDPNVLSLIAKKNAKASGDVRNALEMASNAIQHRLENCDNSGVTKGYLITTKDAFLGNKDAVTIKSAIEGLSMAGQCLLCVLTSLSKAGIVTTTVGELKRHVDDCLSGSGNEGEHLHYEDFLMLLETLVDNGLLKASSTEHGFLLEKTLVDAYQEPISLGVQSEDVENVCEKQLSQAYFVNLREKARELGSQIKK